MQTFLGKKPYAFVPLNKKCIRTKTMEHNNFSTKAFSGRLILSITALTPVHINQGTFGLRENDIYSKMMRRGEKVVIPGSSFKGVIRSIAEAISNSCAPKAPGKDLENALEKSNNSSCSEDQNLCPTCSMFGMAMRKEAYRGKIQFGEFSLAGNDKNLTIVDMPDLDSPFRDYPSNNKLQGNERLYYCELCQDKSGCNSCTKEKFFSLVNSSSSNRNKKFRGRKFYYHNQEQETNKDKRVTKYEVVKKGSVFEGVLAFENLTLKELSLLAHSLGLAENFNLKIGYGKPAYYGSVKVNLLEAEDLLSRYGKKGQVNKEFILKIAKDYRTNQSEELIKLISALESVLGPTKQGPNWPSIDGNKVY